MRLAWKPRNPIPRRSAEVRKLRVVWRAFTGGGRAVKGLVPDPSRARQGQSCGSTNETLLRLTKVLRLTKMLKLLRVHNVLG